jgi:DNA-binding XRE family transcriptional regulator
MRGNESLLEARKNAGITQQEIADELGITRQTYMKIEENPSVATVLQAKRICNILSRSYESIFFGRSASLTSTQSH